MLSLHDLLQCVVCACVRQENVLQIWSMIFEISFVFIFHWVFLTSAMVSILFLFKTWFYKFVRSMYCVSMNEIPVYIAGNHTENNFTFRAWWIFHSFTLKIWLFQEFIKSFYLFIIFFEAEKYITRMKLCVVLWDWDKHNVLCSIHSLWTLKMLVF